MRYLIYLSPLFLLAACAEKKADENEQEAAVLDSPNNFGLDSALQESKNQERISKVVAH